MLNWNKKRHIYQKEQQKEPLIGWGDMHDMFLKMVYAILHTVRTHQHFIKNQWEIFFFFTSYFYFLYRFYI